MPGVNYEYSGLSQKEGSTFEESAGLSGHATPGAGPSRCFRLAIGLGAAMAISFTVIMLLLLGGVFHSLSSSSPAAAGATTILVDPGILSNQSALATEMSLIATQVQQLLKANVTAASTTVIIQNQDALLEAELRGVNTSLIQDLDAKAVVLYDRIASVNASLTLKILSLGSDVFQGMGVLNASTGTQITALRGQLVTVINAVNTSLTQQVALFKAAIYTQMDIFAQNLTAFSISMAQEMTALDNDMTTWNLALNQDISVLNDAVAQNTANLNSNYALTNAQLQAIQASLIGNISVLSNSIISNSTALSNSFTTQLNFLNTTLSQQLQTSYNTLSQSFNSNSFSVGLQINTINGQIFYINQQLQVIQTNFLANFSYLTNNATALAYSIQNMQVSLSLMNVTLQQNTWAAVNGLNVTLLLLINNNFNTLTSTTASLDSRITAANALIASTNSTTWATLTSLSATVGSNQIAVLASIASLSTIVTANNNTQNQVTASIIATANALAQLVTNNNNTQNQVTVAITTTVTALTQTVANNNNTQNQVTAAITATAVALAQTVANNNNTLTTSIANNNNALTTSIATVASTVAANNATQTSVVAALATTVNNNNVTQTSTTNAISSLVSANYNVLNSALAGLSGVVTANAAASANAMTLLTQNVTSNSLALSQTISANNATSLAAIYALSNTVNANANTAAAAVATLTTIVTNNNNSQNQVTATIIATASTLSTLVNSNNVALVNSIATLTAVVTSNNVTQTQVTNAINAVIVSLSQTVASNNVSLTQVTNALSATLTALSATVTANNNTQNQVTLALSQTITALSLVVTNNNNTQNQVTAAIIATATALAQTVANNNNTQNQVTAAIIATAVSLAQTVANNNNTLTQWINAVIQTVSNNNAASIGSISALTTTVNNNNITLTASIALVAATLATLTTTTSANNVTLTGSIAIVAANLAALTATDSANNAALIASIATTNANLNTVNSTLWAKVLSLNLTGGTGSGSTSTNVNGNSGFQVYADVKTNGTGGGASVANQWITRNLTTGTGFLDPVYTSLSPSNGYFTVQAGYYTITASAPAVGAGQHSIRLYDVTLGQVVQTGTSEWTNSASMTAQTRAQLAYPVSLTYAHTYRIDHWVSSAKGNTAATNDGYGEPVGNGNVETYTIVTITQFSSSAASLGSVSVTSQTFYPDPPAVVKPLTSTVACGAVNNAAVIMTTTTTTPSYGISWDLSVSYAMYIQGSGTFTASSWAAYSCNGNTGPFAGSVTTVAGGGGLAGSGSCGCAFPPNTAITLSFSLITTSTCNVVPTSFIPASSYPGEQPISFYNYRFNALNNTFTSTTMNTMVVANITQLNVQGLNVSGNMYAYGVNLSSLAGMATPFQGTGTLGIQTYVETYLPAYTFPGTSASAWNPRVLNVALPGTLDGGAASLNSLGYVTLQPGYYALEASIGSENTNNFIGRIYDVTTSTLVVAGTAQYTGNGVYITSASFVQGTVNITTPHTYVLQLYSTAAGSAGSTPGTQIPATNMTVSYLKITQMSGYSMGTYSTAYAYNVPSLTVNGMPFSVLNVSFSMGMQVYGETYASQVNMPASGTASTPTVSNWNTRVLNTVMSTSGLDALGTTSISGNVLTIAAGTYSIEVYCPAITLDRYQIRLYDVLAAGQAAIGTSEYSSSASTYAQTKSIIRTQLVLTSPRQYTVQIQYQTTSVPVSGFGIGGSSVINETSVFTIVVITQLNGVGVLNTATTINANQINAVSLNATTVTVNNVVFSAANAQVVATQGIQVYNEVSTTGANLGVNTGGTVFVRAINSIGNTGVGSLDSQGITSLNTVTNVITIQPGTYYITASAPMYWAQSHKIQLWDYVAGVEVLRGTSEYSNVATVTRSFIANTITIPAGLAKQYQIRHIATGTNNEGWSYANPDYYATITIQQQTSTGIISSTGTLNANQINATSVNINGVPFLPASVAIPAQQGYQLYGETNILTSNTNTAAASAFNKRAINLAITGNMDQAGTTSLNAATNTITILPGSYKIVAVCNAGSVNNFVASIYDVVAGAAVMYGTDEYASSAYGKSTVIYSYTSTITRQFQLQCAVQTQGNTGSANIGLFGQTYNLFSTFEITQTSGWFSATLTTLTATNFNASFSSIMINGATLFTNSTSALPIPVTILSVLVTTAAGAPASGTFTPALPFSSSAVLTMNTGSTSMIAFYTANTAGSWVQYNFGVQLAGMYELNYCLGIANGVGIVLVTETSTGLVISPAFNTNTAMTTNPAPDNIRAYFSWNPPTTSTNMVIRWANNGTTSAGNSIYMGNQLQLFQMATSAPVAQYYVSNYTIANKLTSGSAVISASPLVSTAVAATVIGSGTRATTTTALLITTTETGAGNAGPIQLLLGNAGNASTIQSVIQNVAYTPLQLNPNGGVVTTYKNTLDDGAGNANIVGSITTSNPITVATVLALSNTGAADTSVTYTSTPTSFLSGSIREIFFTMPTSATVSAFTTISGSVTVGTGAVIGNFFAAGGSGSIGTYIDLALPYVGAYTVPTGLYMVEWTASTNNDNGIITVQTKFGAGAYSAIRTSVDMYQASGTNSVTNMRDYFVVSAAGTVNIRWIQNTKNAGSGYYFSRLAQIRVTKIG